MILKLIETLKEIEGLHDRVEIAKCRISSSSYHTFIGQMVALKNDLGDYKDLDAAFIRYGKAMQGDKRYYSDLEHAEIDRLYRKYLYEEITSVTKAKSMRGLVSALTCQLERYNEACFREYQRKMSLHAFVKNFMKELGLTMEDWRRFNWESL